MLEHYARIVLEHAVRRRYISAAQQVAELAWNRRKDLNTLKQRAEALILGAPATHSVGARCSRRQSGLST